MNQEIKIVQVNSDLEIRLTEIRNQNLEILNYLKDKKPETEQKEFLTRSETAKLFNVSLPTIHLWQENGILHVFKMGRKSFFKYSDLLETLYNSNKKIRL
jgi:predicted site-specific integrase-resolvase